MPTIYIDESGDLGFTSSSTKVFVIAAVVFDDEKLPRRIVKHVRSRLLPEIGTQELKWNKSSPEVRETLLNAVGDEDVDIGYAAILWKEKVSDALRGRRDRLYNYLSYQVIRWLTNRRRGRACNVLMDRSIYGFKVENVNSYIQSDGYKFVQKEWEGKLVLVPSKLNVTVSHVESHRENGLQIADFISGAIYHHCISGFNDRRYYRHIDGRVCGQYHFPPR